MFGELADELIRERFVYEDARIVLLGMDMGRMAHPETFMALEPMVLALADAGNPVLARLPRSLLEREPLERAARLFELLRYGLIKANPQA